MFTGMHFSSDCSFIRRCLFAEMFLSEALFSSATTELAQLEVIFDVRNYFACSSCPLREGGRGGGLEIAINT